MIEIKTIKSALISVYHKENLEELILKLKELNIKIFSTGNTAEYIRKTEVSVTEVEELTQYPSILGGRVKTLHPKVFGGILARRHNETDLKQCAEYEIPEIDLVIVDLYPFAETVKSGASESEIIEKIDIGGISLIRAAAKNFKDVLVVASQKQYSDLAELLKTENGKTSLEDRKRFAAHAFNVSSQYDIDIFNYFNTTEKIPVFKYGEQNSKPLRYGENPHQDGRFFGDFNKMFTQVHGKEISYNNLLDIDAAVNLAAEFSDTVFAILKHNNACGIAIRENPTKAWNAALACDPVSAFGGVVITNRKIDKATAEEIDKIFLEVIIAPNYDAEALEIIKQKKNRIILIQKEFELKKNQFRTILNGVLTQDKDIRTVNSDEIEVVTTKIPDDETLSELIFANIIVKHSKSNAIVITKNKQLLASGIGQTSRVDALKQAIAKAQSFGFDLNGSVMASDAFFPFADSVETASKVGITAVIQPGGSVRDKDSIDFCDNNNLAMVFTGVRHFKH
jgi:phosphoribosylaminoimidazolecarboxamide formyltransferase/IMP cyclohydrolase